MADEEDALHAELDSMTAQIDGEERKFEDWWERQAVRMFNQIAMNIVNAETVWMLLHQIVCAAVPSTGERK